MEDRVKGNNAVEFFSDEEIDGGLIGARPLKRLILSELLKLHQ